MRVPSLSLFVLASSWFWALSGAVSVPGSQTLLALTSGCGAATLLWKADWYEDAWKTILEHRDQAVEYAHRVVEESKQRFNDVADELDHFKAGMDTLVDRARDVRLLLEQYKADPQVLLDRLNDAGSDAVESLQKEFERPLPDDLDERAKYRAEMIASILSQLEDPYITAAKELGIPEDGARGSFAHIRSDIEGTLLVAGNIVDKHPELVTMVIVSTVFMMLPEAFILRTFLRLFGFGPFGPVKGSLAAWLQTRFWGGYVAQRSWFAWMQRAGMVKGWWTTVVSILRAIAALFGL